MYELIQINENDFYIDCPSKMGIVKVSDTEVVMIDSGNDKDAGKKAFRIIEENGWTLKAIYNTHSHADHVGGNRLLQNRTGCRIFANNVECAYTNNPIFEPITLAGGYPPEELLHKFFLAQESHAERLADENVPKGFKVLNLPGHTIDMVGFLTPDGTAFLGDAYMSADTLDKYEISYTFDIEEYLKTLEYLKTIDAKHFVPSHAKVEEDIRETADANIKTVKEVEEKILELTRDECNYETILKRVFTAYGIPMSIEQYYLIGTTIKSYLQCLRKSGKMIMFVRDNEILWRSMEFD